MGFGLPSLISLEASLCRDSLADFSRAAWPIVEPTVDLVWNWHLDLCCDYLEEVESGGIKRLIVNLPPGTSKSTFFGVLFPTWAWTRNASRRFLTFSYSDVNTIRDNRRARLILESEWYKQRFPNVSFIHDQNQKIKYETDETGWRIASSVEGQGTGEHPDFILIDDPLKATSIYYPSRFITCHNWYSSTVSTRLARNPGIVVVMQRLHEDDLAGWLQRKGGWTVLSLPMRFNPKHKNLSMFDVRTKPGELLWPTRLSEEIVQEQEKILGPFQTSAQHGQEPQEGTGKIKVGWLQYIPAVPPDTVFARGWDTGETDEEEARTEGKDPDWTAGVKVGIDGLGRIIIADVIHELTIEHDKLITTTAERDGPECRIVEGSGNGKASTKTRAKKLHGFIHEVYPETESKLQRAQPLISQARAMNIYLIPGPWNDIFISQLTSFPFGTHDDIVDGTVIAYLTLALLGLGGKPRRLTFGKRSRSETDDQPSTATAAVSKSSRIIPPLSKAERRKLMRQ